MPCRSDYPNLTEVETELNTIYNIFDDLDGKLGQFRFPHPRISELDCDEELLHQETEKLCLLLRKLPDVTEYSLITQKWWANHRISDYKRLIKDEKEGKAMDLSLYEQNLFSAKPFLNELIVDAFGFIMNRFNGFSEEQNKNWQISITRASFVQVFSTYELFSELLYFKMKGDELQDPGIFKDFEKSNQFWLDLFGQTYSNWLSFEDQFELQRYFNKYQKVILMERPGMHFFGVVPHSTEENKSMVFTINDSIHAMRILRRVKSALLSFI